MQSTHPGKSTLGLDLAFSSDAGATTALLALRVGGRAYLEPPPTCSYAQGGQSRNPEANRHLDGVQGTVCEAPGAGSATAPPGVPDGIRTRSRCFVRTVLYPVELPARRGRRPHGTARSRFGFPCGAGTRHAIYSTCFVRANGSGFILRAVSMSDELILNQKIPGGGRSSMLRMPEKRRPTAIPRGNHGFNKRNAQSNSCRTTHRSGIYGGCGW